MNARLHAAGTAALLAPAILITAVAFLIPLVRLVGISFSGPEGPWDAYAQLLGDDVYARVFVNTFTIAFVVTVVVCFAFLLPGFGPVTAFMSSWAPPRLVDAVASFSFLTRFESIAKGVIDLRDIVYFLSVIALFLFGTGAAIEAKKAA